ASLTEPQAGIADVAHDGSVRGDARIADGRSLALRGQERGAPIAHAPVRERRTNRDERGQVLILATQPIGNPRAHAWSHEVVAARVQLEQCAAMCRVCAMYGPEDAQVIDVPRDVRKQFTHRQSALAVLPE